MDDQYEYWKDKVECITYNFINHEWTIQFTRPTIPDKTYNDIPFYSASLLLEYLCKHSENMVYDAHDFSECFYGISPETYNYILNRYLIEEE